MILLISPAKSLDYETPVPVKKHSQGEFLDDAKALMSTLRTLNPEQLSSLMHISEKLADLNFQRNLNWQLPFTSDNARQAIFAFTGDVYQGLEAYSLDSKDLTFAQKHLRILSGLYGVLRPLDLIQPYRLEMGSALKHKSNNSLYEFWGTRLAEYINEELDSQRSKTVINLASNEYFKAVDKRTLKHPVISPVFKDYKNGKYKVISFFAKKARGYMTAWVIQNRIDNPESIIDFDVAGYRYAASESSPDAPVFLRKEV